MRAQKPILPEEKGGDGLFQSEASSPPLFFKRTLLLHGEERREGGRGGGGDRSVWTDWEGRKKLRPLKKKNMDGYNLILQKDFGMPYIGVPLVGRKLFPCNLLCEFSAS